MAPTFHRERATHQEINNAATIRAYAGTAAEVVADLLRLGRNGDAVPARQLAYTVLDRAEELLVQFCAGAAARHSGILRSGFEHAVGAAAQALSSALARQTPERLATADAAIAALAGHTLAGTQPHRVEQTRMALRPVRFLARADEPPVTVADGIERQIDQWGLGGPPARPRMGRRGRPRRAEGHLSRGP
ncbi:hypothetical protein [Phytohabitans rumicis]|uniref:Alkaline phosphatase-like protein PglZ second domain-containing protein n=1 Tax=Phytohabitans rumicis TaxID=1076125 RepID=A0A6V8LL92_9ACTN|nr:hypothetical protein [Phytohabitans rumicis]GFJ93405.1 hypothetical protein Prum_070470 [Phytohabitans rumicis]